MKLLITPQEIVHMLHGEVGNLHGSYVNDLAVHVAQRRYIIPVIGQKLFEKMCSDDYPVLCSEYVTPPLAYYVKALVLPTIWAQAGAAGIVQYGGNGIQGITSSDLEKLIRQAKADAHTLMRACVDHIESSGLYPEYDPAENVMNRVSVAGGVVL